MRGAIQYVNARKMGFTEVKLHYRMPSIPYSVSGFTHDNQEKMLIYSLDRTQTYGTLSRNSGISQLELFLKDESGELKYRYIYANDRESSKQTTYKEVLAQFSEYTECFPQYEMDAITDGEVKFFVFAAKNQWGFFVVPISRTESQLYIGREEFYAFENDNWELDFFDGLK